MKKLVSEEKLGLRMGGGKGWIRLLLVGGKGLWVRALLKGASGEGAECE